jgi:ribosome-binding factor A
MENNFDFKIGKKKKDSTIKSQRQLKVGEELRHLISNALHRETFYDEVIETSNITITEVNVSPDLKNAKVYIMPLGGKQKLEVLESLNKVKGYIKKIISSGITLRQVPKISFIIDDSFEYATHIDQILHKIKK